MKDGRKVGKKQEQPFDPYAYPLSDLLEIQRRKVEDLDLRMEPQVCVSWTESDELLPMGVGDYHHNFSFTLAKNAERCGFKWLRPVQQAILPYINAGCNICLATGGCSGKTVGYLIPLIQKVLDDLERNPHKSYHPRAVILSSSREKGKDIFNLLRMLTEGLDINIALSMKGIDPEVQFANRDKADIIVLNYRTLCLILEEESFTLASLKFLVLESIDDLHSDINNGIVVLREILKYYDAFSAGSQMITVVEDIAALQDVFSQERLFHGDNTVIIDHGLNQRLSPSNHVLLRVNNKTTIPVMMELIQHYKQGKAIIVLDRRETKSLEERIKGALDKAGISYVYHHPRFEMAKRAEIQHRISKGEFQVMIVPYCNQLRAFRFPGLKQVIHIGHTCGDDEKFESSYNYSSSCIAFNRKARSVVLFNTENKLHKVASVAETIENCPVIEGWPRNRIPQWAMDFIHGKKTWTEEDMQAAEEMWDLEEAALIPSQEYDEVENRRYSREQNWDSGANPENMMNPNSSFTSPSPAPIGDNYSNANLGGRYNHGGNGSTKGSEWNCDRRALNPARGNGMGNSRFEKPEAFEYEDYERENIGKREFMNSRGGTSGTRGSNHRTSSSNYYDYQEPYCQNDFDDRQDYRCQNLQDYNDWGAQNGHSAQGTSREYFADRQNRSYQGEYPARYMSQNRGSDGPQMRARHESFDDYHNMGSHQNWEMDRHQSNRPVQEQNQREIKSQNNPRDTLGWNQDEPQECSARDRQVMSTHQNWQTDRKQDFCRGGQAESRSQRGSEDRSERSNRAGPQEHDKRQCQNERSGNRFSDGHGGRKGHGGSPNDVPGSWPQGNDRAPRNRFSKQYREWEKTQGISKGPVGKDEPTGSWDTVEDKETPIMGGCSDSEDGV